MEAVFSSGQLASATAQIGFGESVLSNNVVNQEICTMSSASLAAAAAANNSQLLKVMLAAIAVASTR